MGLGLGGAPGLRRRGADEEPRPLAERCDRRMGPRDGRRVLDLNVEDTAQRAPPPSRPVSRAVYAVLTRCTMSAIPTANAPQEATSTAPAAQSLTSWIREWLSGCR